MRCQAFRRKAIRRQKNDLAIRTGNRGNQIERGQHWRRGRNGIRLKVRAAEEAPVVGGTAPLAARLIMAIARPMSIMAKPVTRKPVHQ